MFKKKLLTLYAIAYIIFCTKYLHANAEINSQNVYTFYPNWIYFNETVNNRKKMYINPYVLKYTYNGGQKTDNNFLYPFCYYTKIHQKHEIRLLFSLIKSTSKMEDGKIKKDGQFLPFVFYKRGYGNCDYQALWPIHGTIKNKFLKEQIEWTMWPIRLKTKNGGTTSQWLMWPIINARKGKTNGLALYPLYGRFNSPWKTERFFLWPLGYKHTFFKDKKTIGGFLPFYTYEKSPNVQDRCYFWPFFGYRIEKEPMYREMRFLWPFFVQGRGTKRYLNRFAPIYVKSINTEKSFEKTWFCWPCLKIQNCIEKNAIDIHQSQFFYFFVWHQRQYNHNTKQFLAKKTHFWPFLSHWKNCNGNEQFQMLSPFCVFFQNNHKIMDTYGHLFSLYRYEKIGKIYKYSFLFNLIQKIENKETGESKFKCALLLDYKNTKKDKKFLFLNGLFGYDTINGHRRFHFLWIRSNKKIANIRHNFNVLSKNNFVKNCDITKKVNKKRKCFKKILKKKSCKL